MFLAHFPCYKWIIWVFVSCFKKKEERKLKKKVSLSVRLIVHSSTPLWLFERTVGGRVGWGGLQCPPNHHHPSSSSSSSSLCVSLPLLPLPLKKVSDNRTSPLSAASILTVGLLWLAGLWQHSPHSQCVYWTRLHVALHPPESPGPLSFVCVVPMGGGGLSWTVRSSLWGRWGGRVAKRLCVCSTKRGEER